MKKDMTMEEIIAKAESADLADIVQQYGYSLEGDGDLKRIKELPTIMVDIAQNAYMDYSNGQGGSAVDFVAKHQNLNRESAAQHLFEKIESGSLKTYYNPKAFIPPEKHETNKHMYAYLTKEKGIDGEIINSAIKRGTLYETMHERINQDGEVKRHFHCVFASIDRDRNVRNAFVQSAYEMKGQAPFNYQVKNSDKNFGFNMPGYKENLFVFANPMDALREASLEKMNGMDWRSNHRLALPVLDAAPIERYIKDAKGIDSIYLCLPNDRTSQYHAKRIQEELTAKDYNVILMPMEVSFEEQITAKREAGQQTAPAVERAEQAVPEPFINQEVAAVEKEQNDMDILEESEVDDRVFVLAHDPNAEKPYFVYEKTDGEKTDMESYLTRETAAEAMEDRIDQAEMEAEDMER